MVNLALADVSVAFSIAAEGSGSATPGSFSRVVQCSEHSIIMDFGYILKGSDSGKTERLLRLSNTSGEQISVVIDPTGLNPVYTISPSPSAGPISIPPYSIRPV